MKLNKKSTWVIFLCVALLLVAGAVFAQQSSSKRAIEEGKKYAGTTITLTWEAGLQMRTPQVIIPQWEKLTGMKVKIMEAEFTALHDKQVAEYLAGTGIYDVITLTPAWKADFALIGLAEPLDPYIDKYMNKKDLDDILPIYRQGLMMYRGKTYGLGDDGDIFLLYYRKDLFADLVNKAEFESQYGYELSSPKTWKQFQDIATFFTEKYAPKLYGAVIQRTPGQNYCFFTGHYSSHGGRFFNPETMKPEINKAAGVKTLREMVEQNKVMCPGIETWGPMEVFSAWMNGKAAMLIYWPPYGRWSAGYGSNRSEELSWVPKTQIEGKVGYVPMPGGRSTFAGGFSLGINSQSKHKEAAYAFIQWWTSPEISLQAVILPFSLRDPWRISHFESVLFRNVWTGADEYLDALRKAAETGQWELGIPGAYEYNEAIDVACTAAFGGEDPQTALDEAYRKWEEITNRLGREAQKKAYIEWLKVPGAAP